MKRFFLIVALLFLVSCNDTQKIFFTCSDGQCQFVACGERVVFDSTAEGRARLEDRGDGWYFDGKILCPHPTPKPQGVYRDGKLVGPL